jgi:tetratricopeptide (TPR) repeat protein
MYCKKCGNQIDNDSVFCSHCGVKLNQVNNIKNIDEEKQVTSINHTPSVITDKIKEDKEEKYDLSYKKNYTPTITGIIIIVLNFIILASEFKYEKVTFNILLSISLFLRIAITFWCTDIANKLNRNKTGWGIFAFFFPSIALIIIGLLKKKRIGYYNKYYYKQTSEDKSLLNNNIADKLSKKGKYKEALYYVEKAIKLDPDNDAAYDTRGYIKYYLNDEVGSLKDFDVSISMNPNYSVKYYHRGYAKKELGDLKGAIKDWQIAYKLGNKNAEVPLKKYNKT